MRIPRLLIALLLILACAPAAAAQTPPAPKQDSPTAGGRELVTPQINAKARPLFSAPNAHTLQVPRQYLSSGLDGTTIAKNNGLCYSLRDYRFTQEKPSSDATRFAGSTTCQPATQFHLKGAGSAGSESVELPGLFSQPSIRHCGFAYGNVCPSLTPHRSPITH